MCLGIPMKVVELDVASPDVCWVDAHGGKRLCFSGLVEDLAVGDYVLVHAGMAIEKLLEQDAKSILDLMDDLFSPQEIRSGEQPYASS